MRAFAITFAGIAVLGTVAYLLERRNRAELDGAITDAFKVGGFLAGIERWGTSSMPSVGPPGPYQDPTRKV